MPIFEAILDEVRRDAEKDKLKEGEIPYWLKCPGCGRGVVKKEILSKGCYLCGWHEARDEAELTKIIRDSQVRNDTEEATESYRTDCPRCKARVISHELMERGCYRCGWKPKAPSQTLIKATEVIKCP